MRSDRLSLRQRLLLWLLPPIILLTGIWFWLVYTIAIHFASLAYDRALGDTVETIAAQVSVKDGNLDIDLPAAARRMIEFDRVDQIYFSVADEHGVVDLGNEQIPASARTTLLLNKTSFYDNHVAGRAVRVAERVLEGTTETGHLTIRVAETLEKRKILAREVLLQMIGPQLLFLTAIVIFLWTGVGRGVAPLLAIRDAISRRTHDDLRPLDDKGLPTEVHEQVQAINDLMARLEAVLDSQRRFIADAAHQFRTPVAALRTQVELAVRTSDPDERSAMLSRLDTASKRLVRLTTQLLDLSRAEAGHSMPVEMEGLDLADLIRDVTAWFVPQALERDIGIAVELPESLPVLRGNRHLLEQMLANIIDNAIRYNRDGGHVHVVGEVRDGSLRLIVKDDGPGIPEAQRRQMPKRFYRPVSSNCGGSGLGLAIAHQIALLHDGSVSLNGSSDQAGLEVIVELKMGGP